MAPNLTTVSESFLGLDASRRRALAIAAAVLFVENLFYTAVVPLLPDYAARLALSQAEVGLIIGVYSAGVIAGSVPGVIVARRSGFPTTAAAGLTVLAISTALFGVSESFAGLVAMRFVQGVGGGLTWMGALGWIASIAPPDRRGAVIGSALAVAVSGALLGPLAGGLAVAAGPEAVFGALAVLQGGLAAAVWARRGHRTAPGAVAPPRRESPGAAPVGARAAAWFVGLPALLAGLYEALTPLQLDAAGATASVIVIVFILGAAGEVVVAPAVGRLSDRVGRVPPLRVALFLAPALCVSLSAVSDELGLATIAVFAWLAIAAAWAPGLALVADLAQGDPDRASIHWARLNVIISGGVMIGSILGAIVAERVGEGLPYLVVGAGCLYAILRARDLLPRRIGEATAK